MNLSPRIHKLRINPLSRLMWTQKEARNNWQEKFYMAQTLVQSAMVEAFKQGVLSTYGFWNPNNLDNSALISELEEYGRAIYTVKAGTSPHRTHKAYVWFNRSTGSYTLFSNKDNIKMIPDDIFELYDLNLTAFGYTNANEENLDWYTSFAIQGIYDPIGEMENQDMMNPYLNPFLRHLGIYIIPYIANSWNDEYSLDLAHKLFEIMQSIDKESADTVMNLLELPTRWNCWRGVSIIDTPIFKSVTDSVPYRENVIVDYELPKMSNLINRAKIPGAAKGTVFPYLTKLGEQTFNSK